MPDTSVTIVVPTLACSNELLDCLASLERQTWKGHETVVVDNSGDGAVRRLGAERFKFRLIESEVNAGFGGAVNQGWRLAPSAYLAVLNDDAEADAKWLEELVGALEANPRAGMAASQVRLKGKGVLDSAGMGLARDGSSKQVGRMGSPQTEADPREALIPSGCAALYRGAMLNEIGLFDESFFLYCEDTDLALRGHWAGWSAVYVPTAVVHHRYSASAGEASAAKAYYVERNRLRCAIRNLPVSWLLLLPLMSAARYVHHALALAAGRGKAGAYLKSRQPAWLLAWLVIKAHLVLLRDLPRLLRERWSIMSRRKLSVPEFARLLRRHRISLREVAEQ